MISAKGGSYYPTILIALSVGYAAWIWVAAKSPWHYSDPLLGATLFASLCLFGAGLLAVNLITAVVGRTMWPLAVFALCALVPWLLPTITPEEIYFAQHKPEYQKLVELVRLKQIQHAGNCQVDDYMPPVGFEKLTLTRCMLVRYEPETSLLLTPSVRGRLLLYTENGNPDIMCSGSVGVVEKKLDEHWYICDGSWKSWP